MTKKEKFLVYLLVSIATIVVNGAFRVFDPTQAASVEYVNEENQKQDIKTEKRRDDIIKYIDKMDNKIDDKIDDTKTLFLDEIRMLRQDLKLKVDKN